VLDGDGTIVAVNNAWLMFTLDNGGAESSTGVGVNYLDVCRRSATAGCADAGAVAAGLQAVMRGETVECELEYPCPSPAAGRWFVLRVTPVASPDPGLLVSHLNISRRKMAEQSLERKATQDPLTGLANRTLFGERLTTALAKRSARTPTAKVGLLYIDLDGFKPVNDTYGHAAGDEVLQNVASRIGEVARPQDTVARLGGDEFAVLAPRTSAEDLRRLAARLDAELEVPHLIHGQEVVVGASIGTDLASIGDDLATSLQRADQAMYVVKRARSSQRG
jgi:diguanylate cyclase (GGDEF)-like protein